MVLVGQDVEAVALSGKDIIRSTPTLTSPSATSKMTTTHVDMGVPNNFWVVLGSILGSSVLRKLLDTVAPSPKTPGTTIPCAQKPPNGGFS